MSMEQRKEAIANHYAELFGIEAMRYPSGYIEKHWDDEAEKQFSGPCVFSLPPGFLSTYRRFWGESHGRVVFAGSESSNVFRGYMEGGVRSAERAALQVLKLIGRVPMTIDGKLDQHAVGVPYNELTFIERWIPSVTHLIAGSIVAVTAVCITFYT